MTENIKVLGFFETSQKYFISDEFVTFINSIGNDYTINEVSNEGTSYIDVVYFDKSNFIKLKRFFLKRRF